MEPVVSTRTFLITTALAIAAVLATAALVMATGEPTDGGNGSPLGDGVLETEGDWVVETGATIPFTNVTIIVNGNLTVSVGGTLTLRGVELVVNATGEYPLTITVEPTGVLVVRDYDGVAATTTDTSAIRSFWNFNRFSFEVQPEGVLRVQRSSLSDLGSEVGLGLHVLSDDVTLEDVTVSDFDSIFVESADPGFVRVAFKGSEDSALYFLSSGATFEDCTIEDCFSALNVRGNPAPSATNLTITNCFVALDIEMADITIRGGLMRVAAFGTPLRLNETSHATLVDVDLDEDLVEFKDATSSYEAWWTMKLTVLDQDGRPVEAASIEVNDTRGGMVWTGATGPNGTVVVEVLDRIRTNSSVDGRNPHTVTVRKDRYRAIDVLSVTAPTERELRLTTNLAPMVEVVSPRPNTRVVMNQALLLDATGSRDPNGDPLTYRWTTNLGDRLLYEGPLAVVQGSLLFGETTITLTISDGLGGVNSTAIPVEVLQATAVTLTLVRPQFNATLQAVFGGTGTLALDEAEVSPPYGSDLIGVFIIVHSQGDAVFASGTLSVRYSPTLLPFGMDESTIHIAREDSGLWLALPGSTVDGTSHTVAAQIPSFGVYAVRGVIPPNIPPRLRMYEAGVNVAPHDLVVPVGSAIELVFTAEDELPAFAMLDVQGLPEGLSLDRSTKRVWGTLPPANGTWQLHLTLTDAGGLTASADIWLNTTGEPSGPQLWSPLIDPEGGDTDTVFEAKVLYRSELNLPPKHVVVEIDGKRYDLVAVDPADHDWVMGVMFHTFIMLDQKDDPYEVVFNASDGVTTTTTDPVELDVGWPDFSPTSVETAIILSGIVAIVVLIAVIRLTSKRYNMLRTAHVGKDREDSIDYIRPGDKGTGGDKLPDGAEVAPVKGEAPIGGGPAAPPSGPEGATPPADKVDDLDDVDGVGEVDKEDAPVVRPPEGPPPEAKADGRRKSRSGDLDEEVERLDSELGKLDEEIDGEEAALTKLDEDIEGIIDELESDKKRTG